MEIYNRALVRITRTLAATTFVRQALADRSGLDAFREKPSAAIRAGLGLIGFSYLIGWPAVAALGAVAIHLKRPAIALLGGPATYALSHLVFIAGVYLCGRRYPLILLRWLTRVGMEKLLARAARGQDPA